MAGFGHEGIIEYFYRNIAGIVQRIGTDDWPVVNAIIINSAFRDSVFGCTVVVLRYKYRNANQRFEGTHKEPFFFENYAEAYLRRYPGGSEFPVRVSPKDPSYSIPAVRKITFTRAE